MRNRYNMAELGQQRGRLMKRYAHLIVVFPNPKILRLQMSLSSSSLGSETCSDTRRSQPKSLIMRRAFITEIKLRSGFMSDDVERMAYSQ